MRSNPKLVSGVNRLWIKFFLVAVYATMYVRDHARPVFHAALGIDPTEYDLQVFRITSEISRQVFPLTLDTDGPAFRAGLDRLVRITQAMSGSKRTLAGRLKRAALGAAAGATVLRLFLLPPKRNPLPAQIRLAPAW